ncbi:hypothetical protein C380_08855 [Acidovorax sp. KKS102]|uniref:PLxRFG domain-containing protein n=1 Tax=Acidovorax sp. KKS102 TaxID=358220 RepID=UPI00028B512E|nr:PLxRFG domain-containing protein [Acidovorax sp. KKS102]AFU45473.1 hypothetical protein C380_08855 [Acidovorax sp. KKS102]
MSDTFSYEDAAKPAPSTKSESAKPFSYEEATGQTPSRGFKGWAQDVAGTAINSAISVPEAVVGLADIPTGGAVGKFLENEGGSVGFRPKQAKEFVNETIKSDASREAHRKFNEADGIVDKTVAAIQNPSLILEGVGESLGAMGAGGVASRGLMAATKLGQMGAKGAALAGAAGEGITMAGSAAEQIRQETPDGSLTPTQSGLALATGLVGGAIGAFSGRVANKLGIGDAETMLAQGTKGMAKTEADGAARAAANPLVQQLAAKSIPRQVISGAISEGFLEELPQSVAEQIFQNVALGKDWLTDVDSAVVMGVLSGGAMGGAAAGYHGIRQPKGGAGDAPTAQPGAVPADGGAQPGAAPTNPGMERIQQAFAAQLAALQQQEQGDPPVPQTAPPDGAAALAQQQAQAEAQRQAAIDASRAVQSPDDEIYQSTGMQSSQNVTRDENAAPSIADMLDTDAVYRAWSNLRDGSDRSTMRGQMDYVERTYGGKVSPENRASAEKELAQQFKWFRAATPEQRAATMDRLSAPDPVKPSVAMGLNPAAGPLSAGAALAVDTGVSDQVQQAAALAQAAEVAQKQGKKPAQSNQKQERQALTQQGVNQETGEISQGLPMESWSDAQLSNTFRGAQSREVRMQLAQELGRRRALREQQELQAELDAEQRASVPGAERADAAFASLTEDAGPVPADLTIPATTEGNRNGPQAAQAQQGSAQPSQVGAAPAVARGAPDAQGRSGADGAQQAAAAGLIDGAPTANPGMQAAAAPGAQVAPQAEGSAQRVASTGDAWTRMPTAERQALAQRADLKPIVRKNVHRAAWADLNRDVQRKLAEAMEPSAKNDATYTKALELVRSAGVVKRPAIQDALGIGFDEVNALMERMEREGVVTAAKANGERALLSVGTSPTGEAAPVAAPSVSRQDAEQEQAGTSAESAPAAINSEADKDGNTIVGRRSDGVMIRQDKNGVRWYAQGGVRIEETVSMRPTRQGMQVTRGELKPEFMTAAESEAAKSAASPAPAAENAINVSDENQTGTSTKEAPVATNSVAKKAPPAAKKPSADQVRAQADLMNALADLGDILGKNTRMNIMPEQEQKLLPVLTRVLDAAFRLGYHKFKDSAKFALDQIRANLGDDAADALTLDHLQGAYIAMAGGKTGADTKRAVIDVESKAEIEAHEASVAAEEDEADNAQQENPSDERTTVRSESPQALDAVAAQEGGRAESERGAGAGAANSGQTGAAGSAVADGAGFSPARGGGSGVEPVRAPKTRARGRAGAVGAQGAGATGEPVPQADGRVAVPGGEASAPNIPAADFQITDEVGLGKGGEVQKFTDNLAAIRTLKAIEAANRRATPEEQAMLARYVGWGGLANAFPDPGTGQFKDKWRARGEELRDLLTKEEYTAARRSTRNAHYTSQTVVSAMWDMVRRLGYRGGLVLESSMGSGNFLGLAPKDMPNRFVGVEYDSLTARIGQALYPQATVLHSGFQKVPVADNAFMLNIGNPPFGSESLRFQFKPELQGVSIHNQFFRAGMDALRPGGIQAMVVSRFLMDAQDKSSRLALAAQARLVAAIRLPDTAFKENARTEVVTDILIFQKMDAGDQAAMQAAITEYNKLKANKKGADAAAAALVPSWVETVKVPDPLGGEAMNVNAYFAENPANVLGVMERSGSMQHGADITVRLDNPAELGELLRAAVQRLPEGIQNFQQDVLDATAARHKSMSDALRIAVANEEAGHIKASPDGKLQRVIERETPEGDFEFAYQEIDENSPWHESLSQNAEGQWYSMEPVLDEQGKNVKAMNANGEATRKNLYERKVYAKPEDVPEKLRLGKLGMKRLSGLVGLRDLLKRQLVLETADAVPAMMEGNRKSLAAAYEAFVKANGPVGRATNMRLAMTMPDGGLIAALEVDYQPERTAEQAARSGLEAQKEKATPAPILRERVVPKYEPATKAASPSDALAITLAESGRVDMDRIASLLDISPEQAGEALQQGTDPLVFKDPETGLWETADAYLSGMVKRKLNAARAAGMTKNAQALEKVIPADWTAENVAVTMGATWVPPEIYADFVRHLVGGKARVSFSALTNSFSVSVDGAERTSMSNWSSEGAPADYIITRILNSKAVTVTARDADGNTFIDKERTALAGLKAREIEAEFGDWVFKNGERRQRLVDVFNEKFNTRVVRQFNGQHLQLPGKVPDAILKMRRHQMNAIWRGIYERFMLVDHAVGAGKTFTAIARAMERRRMGLSRKPMVAVPNHLVEQWAADVYRLYPGAKVLAAGKKDFEAKRRRRLFGKIATGDWDIVIVPHSSFGFIGIAPETESRYLELEMAQAQAAIEDAWEQAKEDGTDNGRRKPFNVKEAERLAEKIQARMDRLAEGVRDRLLTFEQLGVDDLTVDEAHEFKNLYYSSNLTGVRGMGDKTGSRKANDLYNKVRVLREQPTGSVTFLTGTPISNSAVEMFTMLRYLAADALDEMGLSHFDAFRAQFVEATPAFEPTESGRLKQVTRLGRTWSNMRSLMDLYYQVTDAVSLDDIKRFYAEDNPGREFPVPKVAGGKDRNLVAIKPTPAQEQGLKEVMDGFDGLDGIEDPYERNAERLRLMDRARKLSLDIRAVDPRSTSAEEGGKLQVVSENIKRIYDKWDADKGTQLVFLDRSVPKAKGDDAIIKAYDDLIAKRDAALRDDNQEAFDEAQEALDRYDPQEIAELRMAQTSPWSAYQQIKDNLIAAGIPANEIRFVQEANNDEQKAALFDAVNGGKVRVMIGSTPRMGAGTNVQQRIVALHHVDVTWKPSDIEQREGRAIRQGNLLLEKYGDSFEVEILAYATERTVDAKMWDLNATKLRTINGIRKYDGAFSMEFDDEEAVGMAEMAALASGNPLLLERVKTESEITTLELQERAFRRRMFGIEDAVDSAERAIERNPGRIADERAKKVKANAAMEAADARKAARRVTIEGKEYDNLRDAMTAVNEAIEQQQGGKPTARYSISVDGARLTNKDGIDTAIGAALGDASLFDVTIDGRLIAQHTVAARELAAKFNELTKGIQAGDSRTATVGDMLGYDLVLDAQARETGKGGAQIDASVSLVDADGTTVTSRGLNSFAVNQSVVPANVRNLVTDLFDDIGRLANSSTDYLERQLARAKADLPALREQLNQTFPKAAELVAKRERLRELVGMLEGKPQSAVQTTPEEAEAGDGSPGGDVAAFRRDGAESSERATEFDVDSFLKAMGRPAAYSEAAQRQAIDSVSATVDAIRTAWGPNAPEVVVAFDMQDERIPEAARKADLRQRSGGARGAPEGFYYRGKAYLVASRLNTPNDAARVLYHEVLGHHGLRGKFGRDLDQVLNQIATMRKAEVAAKMQEYGLRGVNSLSVREAAEEVLAEMAEKNPQLPFVQRAISAIRNFLRTHVPGFQSLRLTDSDIIQAYIMPARGWVERGGPGGPGGGVSFSRDAGRMEADALRLLAAAARSSGNENTTLVLGPVTDDALAMLQREGVPVESGYRHTADMYAVRHALSRHGDAQVEAKQGQLPLSDADIAAIPEAIAAPDAWILGAKTPRGQDIVGNLKRLPDGTVLYLEEVRSGRKALAMTSMRKYPGTTDFETIRNRIVPSYAQSDTGDLRIVYPAGAAGQGEVLFSRSSMADLKDSALQQIHQTLSHPGKVSLWDKTVGTMRNLAERSPVFKPVYEAAQRFIDDVSMLGNDAADRAPRLLPRVETLADLKKKPITAADNQAVAKPLFEGTLLWARDVDGKPVTTEALNAKYRNTTPDEKAQILLRTGKIQEQMLKVWRGLPVDQYNTIINNKFDSTILKPGVVWTAKELKDLFDLSAQQVSLYQEARAAIDRSIDMTARADMLRALGAGYAGLREAVLAQASVEDAMVLITDTLQAEAREQPDQADRILSLNNAVVKSYERAQALMEAGYAPLSRFGRYTVDVVGKDGTREYFGMFESMYESNKMKAAMEKEFPGATVTQGTMSDEAFKLFQGITPESLEHFGEMLGLSGDGSDPKDKAFQAYLQLAKNNHSALKRLIHRKGISGYSEDVGRVLASFVYSNARLAAGGLNAGTLETAIEGIPKEQGELRDVAMGLRSYIQDPQEEGQAVRGMLFAQYLGGSVASAMVNMTQPFQITMPWLSQFGGMRSAASHLAAAVRDMTRRSSYEPDLAKALQTAEAEGIVSPQEIHQLMAQARGAGSLRTGDGTKLGDARAAAANNWERVKVAWGQPFALAEQFNRRSTFIAAYRIAKEQGMADPAKFAERAVQETQFVYSKANKPKWARGAIGGTLFTFKTYSVSYLELMHRMWSQGGPEGKRAVGWAVAMLLLMGGAGGLPFMEDAEDLIDGAGQLMGYNISTKHWRKQALRDVVGKELADFMEQGVSGLPGAPIDVSGRLGMGNLIPGTGLLLAKQNRERDLLEVAGPAGDLVARGFTGARKLLTGDVVGAALEVSPTAARNWAKGIDMGTSGIYKDAKGYKVIDTTLEEAIAKFAGFQPKSVAEVQEANSFMQRSKSFYIQTSNDIKAQWAQAVFEKDDAALQRVRDRLAAWNRNNPDQPIVVKIPDVMKRVREMGKDRTQRIADTAPKALRDQMRSMAKENG